MGGMRLPCRVPQGVHQMKSRGLITFARVDKEMTECDAATWAG